MGGTEFGFQKTTVRKKSDGKLGRLRPSSARRVSSRSSMKRSGGSSAIRRSNLREGDWRRFANTSRTHLSHIICCAMKHTSNAASTERKASSNACSGCGWANRSCPNSKCAIRCPEDERIGVSRERALRYTLSRLRRARQTDPWQGFRAHAKDEQADQNILLL